MTIMKRLLNYLEFRLYKKRPLLPVSKEDLLSWLVDTSGHVKYGTVKGWVSVLKRAMIDSQMDYSAFDDPWFRAGMTGLQRIMGETRPRQALPVTLPILSAVLSAAFKGCSKLRHRYHWASDAFSGAANSHTSISTRRSIFAEGMSIFTRIRPRCGYGSARWIARVRAERCLSPWLPTPGLRTCARPGYSAHYLWNTRLIRTRLYSL
jgi:hypothetical protein